MAYVIYLDQLFLVAGINFLFDFLLLWATREITQLPAQRSRLLWGAGWGTLYFLAHRLAFYGIIPFYGWLSSPVMMLLISLSMLGITFHPVPRGQYLPIIGYFHLIFLTAGGAGLLVSTYLFGNPYQPQILFGSLTSLGVLLIMAELGWGLIQKQIWQHLYQITLLIDLGEESIMVNALVDSGNRLQDPLSRQPVIIVEHEALKPLLPPAISQGVEELAKGKLDHLHELPREWSAKVRLLPFRSIGQAQGMLLGFRVQEVSMLNGEQRIPLSKGQIIGLSPEKLCPDGFYKALIHPQLIAAPLTREGVDVGQFQLSEEIHQRGRTIDVTHKGKI
ncbi:MAG: sigma-E processing peptidase SpoIIGA [Limnochordia bacterium]|jgi:stage II sporulation protein GA (sporulation sigma-E factor processing peptidase)